MEPLELLNEESPLDNFNSQGFIQSNNSNPFKIQDDSIKKQEQKSSKLGSQYSAEDYRQPAESEKSEAEESDSQ